MRPRRRFPASMLSEPNGTNDILHRQRWWFRQPDEPAGGVSTRLTMEIEPVLVPGTLEGVTLQHKVHTRPMATR